ncbi:zinc finger, CCHC-type containing protein [Tanacetum coccineum]
MVVLVPTRNLNWNVGSVAKLATLRGIDIVETRRIKQMLVVREKGLRTIPKTKVDAIAWWIDSDATTHVCKDRCWFKTYEPVEDGSVLYMGDDHFAPVHGKGSKFDLINDREPAMDCNIKTFYGLNKKVASVKNVKKLTKLDMNLNDALPHIEVDPEPYAVTADGVHLTCAEATTVPLSRNYFLF